MRHTTLARCIPLPTEAEIAEARAHAEATRQRERNRLAAIEAHKRAMRGRSLRVLGHDGRTIYVRIARPGRGEHEYRLPLYPMSGATKCFLRFAAAHGQNWNTIYTFSL